MQGFAVDNRHSPATERKIFEMNLEELFNRANIIDLSFFNFRNAITAAYFADRNLRIQKVNENFRSFFPVLGNVKNAYFPDVLLQLGVPEDQVTRFKADLERAHKVLVPEIHIHVDGEEKVYSLLSTYTEDASFSYLNGVQGQFVDRTREFQLRRDKEKLLEHKMRAQRLIEEKSRQLETLANRLAKYLAPQVYDSIFSTASDTARRTARKNLTLFFSDIVGFTDISDGIDPERLSFVVNTYLSEMSAIAIEYGGTIDKFIGDAMLVFFGDPDTEGEQNDALRCLMMAVTMMRRVAELQDLWQSHGISKPLGVRMGISTGYCTVGDFGSDQRLDYTAIGGPVNLASRLQSMAEPNTIQLDATTMLLVQDFVTVTHVTDIAPKGFARATSVYRLEEINLKDAIARRESLRHIGRHVEVNIPDRKRIREAIEELKKIEEDFATRLKDQEENNR